MLPVAISLATQFAPAIIRWLSGDKAGATAEKVLDIASIVTGAGDIDDINQILQDNEDARAAFIQQTTTLSAHLYELEIADMQHARQRDVDIRQLGKHNIRADLMIMLDVIGLLGCVVGIIYMMTQNPEVRGVTEVLGVVIGYFGQGLAQAHNFEFGSTRASREKNVSLAKMVEK